MENKQKAILQEIELFEGIITNLKGSIEFDNNSTYSSYYFSQNIIISLFCKFFLRRKSNFLLVFLAIFAILTSVETPNSYLKHEAPILFNMFISGLCLQLIIFVVVELLEEVPTIIRDRAINNQLCIRYCKEIQQEKNRISLLETVKRSILKIGDIVIVSSYESSPADLLLLHSQAQIIRIDSTGFLENNQPYKKSISIRQLKNQVDTNQFCLSSRKFLTGKIQYQISTLTGTIKLQNELGGIQFNQDYIIHKNSRLIYPKFILGVVLRVGDKMEKKGRFKQEANSQKIQMFNIFTLLFMILLLAVEISLDIYNDATFQLQAYEFIYIRLFPYGFIFPYCSYMFVDLIKICEKTYQILTFGGSENVPNAGPQEKSQNQQISILKKKNFQLPSIQNMNLNQYIEQNRILSKTYNTVTQAQFQTKLFNKIQQNNLIVENETRKAFFGRHEQNLALTTDIIFDMNNIITSQMNKKVQLLYFQNQIYQVDDNRLKKYQKVAKLKGFSAELMQKIDSSKSFVSSASSSKFYPKNKNQINILQEQKQIESSEFFLAIALLSESYASYYDRNDSIIQNNENIWTKLADSVGIKIHLVWQTSSLHLCLGPQYMRYSCEYIVGPQYTAIYVIDQFEKDQSCKYFFLIRIISKTIPVEIESSNKFINKVLYSFIKNGNIPYIIGKCCLSKQQYELSSPRTILTVQIGGVQKWFPKFVNSKRKLEFMGIIGIKEQINRDFTKCLKKLRESDLHISIISKSSQASTLAVVSQSENISNVEIITISGAELDDLKNQIEKLCSRFGKFFQKSKSIGAYTYIQFKEIQKQLEEYAAISNSEQIYGLSRLKRYILIIDSQSFNLLKTDKVVLAHLAFLNQFSYQTIYTNMNQSQKGEIVNFIKQYKYNYRNTKVTVVASNIKDNLMMINADCGIQLVRSNVGFNSICEQLNTNCDMVITNLELLPTLISTVTQQNVRVKWYVIRMVFYVSIAFTTLFSGMRILTIHLDHTGFLILMVNWISIFVFAIIQAKSITEKGKQQKQNIQWKTKSLMEQMKVNHQIDFICNSFFKGLTDSCVTYTVIASMFYYLQTLANTTYIFIYIAMSMVIGIRQLQSFKFKYSNLIIIIVLFLETLFSYALIGHFTLNEFFAFLGTIMGYKQTYMVLLMLFLWTYLTKRFIGNFNPIKIYKNIEFPLIISQLKGANVILRQQMIRIKYLIFKKVRDIHLPSIFMFKINEIKLYDIFFGYDSQINVEFKNSSFAKFRGFELRMNLLKIIVTQQIILFLCNPIGTLGIYLELLYMATQISIFVWQCNTRYFWVYNLSPIVRVLAVASILYSNQDSVSFLNIFCISYLLTFSYLNNVWVVCLSIIAINLAYMIQYPMDLSMIPNIAMVALIYRYILKCYNIRKGLNNQNLSSSRGVQLENILSLILPKFIRNKIQGSDVFLSEDQGELVVCFCDFYQFDKVVAQQKQKIVEIIDDLFRNFDKICADNDLIKIQTVGKTYMVAAGINPNHKQYSVTQNILRTIKFGMQLLQFLQSSDQYNKLTLKIGINYGSCYAGVIGFHKPQFSLIGDTINTTARVCVLSDKGQVNISSSVYQRIKTTSGFIFSEQVIKAKGKGDLFVYGVRKKTERKKVRVVNTLLSPIYQGYKPQILEEETKDLSIDDISKLLKQIPLVTDKSKTKFFQQSSSQFKIIRQVSKIASFSFGSFFIYICFIKKLVTLNPVPYIYLSLHLIIALIILVGFIKKKSSVWFFLCYLLLIAYFFKYPYADIFIVMVLFTLEESYYLHYLVILMVCPNNLLAMIPTILITIYQNSYYTKNVQPYLIVEQLANDNQKFEYYINYMFPKHIVNKFFSNPSKKLDLVQTYQDATILFADIAGFTKYSASVTPASVVNMLKSLFYKFDKEVLNNNVYKVYTIGDCYVILGVNDVFNRNPYKEALNVIQTGFRMIEIIKKVRKEVNFQGLNMRIGVHTGKLIGGVIGTDVVRYDLYGVDVMIANKMQSSGIQGKVQVSQSTMKLLMEEAEENERSKYKFTENAVVQTEDTQIRGYIIDKII